MARIVVGLHSEFHWTNLLKLKMANVPKPALKVKFGHNLCMDVDELLPGSKHLALGNLFILYSI